MITEQQANQIKGKIKNVANVAKAIKAETVPFENHPDPGAIADCWNEVFEQLDDLLDAIGALEEQLPEPTLNVPGFGWMDI